MSNIYDVVVVGAGVSGLYAAHTIQKAGKSVLVVEASSIVGGRIRQCSDFSDWYTELGGEIIHGEKTALYNILTDELGLELTPIFRSYPDSCVDNDIDYSDCQAIKDIHIGSQTSNGDGTSSIQSAEWIWMGREAIMIPYDNRHPQVNQLTRVLYQLETGPLIEPNCTFLKYLVDHDVPYSMLGVADAMWAQVAGSSLECIGANEMRDEMIRTKQEGSEFNYRYPGSFKVLVDHLKKMLDVRTNFVVKKIEVAKDRRNENIAGDEGNSSGQDLANVIITNQDGKMVYGRCAIISVPLAVLKAKSIAFSPSLPLSKVNAIDQMGMDNGAKIFVQFSKRFWPCEAMQLVICSDSFIPEFWVDGGNYRSPDAYWTIIGFAMGDIATCLQSKTDDEVIRLLLSQLNQMFGNEQELNPATKYLVKGMVYKWNGEREHILGGYSYPRFGSLGASKILAQPVAETLFFCGEATNFESEIGTVNAAILTGKRAALEALKSS